MSNYNLNQSILFYIQILLSSSFIFTILISISLSYNEILKLQNKKSNKDSHESAETILYGSPYCVPGRLYILQESALPAKFGNHQPD